MFCSNCGKSIRPEEDACRHCGAILGKNRFYGSTYTSSQVRLPAHEINNAPAGGRMSYTRTDYMSFDNQPEKDIYSGTTYRPLLSDDEDLTRIEAEEEAARIAEEEAARAAEEEARVAEEEAARAAEEEARAAEEAARAAEEEAARAAEEAARAAEEEARAAEEEADFFEDGQEAEDVAYTSDEEVYGESADESEENESDEDEDDEDEYDYDYDADFPEDLTEGKISPRVEQYMREQEEAKNAPPRKMTDRLRITPFLNLNLNLKRRFMPAEDQTAAEQNAPVEEYAAEPSYEAPENASDEYVEEEYVQDEQPQDEYAEEEYVQDEQPQDEYAEEEYVQDEYAEDAYAQDEPASDEYAEDAYAQDELPLDDYAEEGYAQDNQPQEEYAQDEEYSEAGENAFKLDVAELLERARTGLNDLLKNRMLAIGVAAVLIILVLIGGISWLNYITAKRAKIPGVTYSAYSQGIEMLTANTNESYRSEHQQLCLTNTAMASASFNEDMAQLNALLPANPQENDELFITSLTIIQDSIVKAIREDAQAELNGTSAQNASSSAARWQAISHAISQLSLATTPGELTRIVAELDSVVNPTPSPTPVPTPVRYDTLTVGTMDSTEVRVMQNRLINLGYLSGNADGDFGSGTENAVKAFQRAAGLTANGVADHATLEAMYADNAPRTGGSAPSNPSN